LEQQPLIARPIETALATSTFLGRHITLHEDPDAFAASETVGVCASLCLRASDFEVTPVAGQVVAGEVFIAGSLVDFEPDRSPRRWLQGKPAHRLRRK
jgi:hypothetical protein